MTIIFVHERGISGEVFGLYHKYMYKWCILMTLNKYVTYDLMRNGIFLHEF